MTSNGGHPAGWYPVKDRAIERWHDGTAWTEHVRPASASAPDLPTVPARAAQAVRDALSGIEETAPRVTPTKPAPTKATPHLSVVRD